MQGRGDSPEYDKKDVNVTDVLFMSSRAGATRYDRPFTEAFIRPGLDPARWRNRGNYVALNIIPTSPTELSIYHRSGDRYVVRTDGFISVHTGAKPGELLTKPIRFTGRELVLNLSTSAAGGVQVEIRKAGGEAIPGFTLADCEVAYGDEIERAMKWKGGDLKSLAGQSVQMRFVMKECDVYSYRFR